MTSDKVRTQIIGAAGEALVTYKLLKHEIDSARMTTDSGVDLDMTANEIDIILDGIAMRRSV